MTSPRILAMPALGLVTALLLAGASAHADTHSEAMLKLARASGCMSCHQIAPGGKGPDGLPPIGPAWQEVASKYKGSEKSRKSAEAKLLQTVMAGSNPYDSHWKGKVSGLAMPPNAVAIQEADARRLVKWILRLPAVKSGA